MTSRDWPQTLRGQFITFEGIDGCGKSTQAARLTARLRELALPVLATREPGGTPIGSALREILLSGDHGEMIPQCELLLYLADRVQHLAQDIRPALDRGETVICDRYHDATVAYQHYGRQLDFAAVQPLIDAEITVTPPQLTLWLDLPATLARERIAGRASGDSTAHDNPGRSNPEHGNPGHGNPEQQGADRMDGEALAFHERVRVGYAALHEAHPGRIVRIDALQSVSEVEGAIWACIEERYRVA